MKSLLFDFFPHQETFTSIFGVPGLVYLLLAIFAAISGILALKTGRIYFGASYFCLAIMPFLLAVVISAFQIVLCLHALHEAYNEKIMLSLDALLLELGRKLIVNTIIGCGLSFVVLIIAPLYTITKAIKQKMGMFSGIGKYDYNSPGDSVSGKPAESGVKTPENDAGK